MKCGVLHHFYLEAGEHRSEGDIGGFGATILATHKHYISFSRTGMSSWMQTYPPAQVPNSHNPLDLQQAFPVQREGFPL